MLGKIEGRKRRGQQRTRWLDPPPGGVGVREPKSWDVGAGAKGLSRSGGEKGLGGSGAGTLGVPLEGTRRVGA